ncbi:hypothetical protein P9K31_00580 [Corynebacterium glutamicum]|uniref:hypothetical protein n=1 Tax=Corynebacterium TaxID=1716 RepID=UPI0007227406|nr:MULTISPECIES: hypothetical protein [Corynebacterium]ALP51312.1 hypothetical protein AC079_14590 [Corynebacterium glutamicum]ANR63810.1 hypothetical protein C628_14630 [[Brevibacterium] flavum ZL-1]ANR66818.1 hypothetical protein C627_14495 [Corynebacterium glutamicum ZL-6]ANU34838.1 hypothetical protein BBD29_14375 [Corynebacterium glutamicum]APT08593.1 hypothetical protein BSP99_14840 [Corynebacterium glutamicum]
MYSLLWHYLPGPWFVKLLIVLALIVLVFFLLMDVVFPWVSTLMPYNDVAL